MKAKERPRTPPPPRHGDDDSEESGDGYEWYDFPLDPEATQQERNADANELTKQHFMKWAEEGGDSRQAVIHAQEAMRRSEESFLNALENGDDYKEQRDEAQAANKKAEAAAVAAQEEVVRVTAKAQAAIQELETQLEASKALAAEEAAARAAAEEEVKQLKARVRKLEFQSTPVSKPPLGQGQASIPKKSEELPQPLPKKPKLTATAYVTPRKSADPADGTPMEIDEGAKSSGTTIPREVPSRPELPSQKEVDSVLPLLADFSRGKDERKLTENIIIINLCSFLYWSIHHGFREEKNRPCQLSKSPVQIGFFDKLDRGPQQRCRDATWVWNRLEAVGMHPGAFRDEYRGLVKAMLTTHANPRVQETTGTPSFGKDGETVWDW